MLYSGEKINEILYSGWGELEGGFIWSTSKYASLLLPIDKRDDAFGLQLVVEPFLVAGMHSEQSIEIYCNGLFVLGHVFNKLEKKILFTEIHPSLSSFGSLKIDFIFPDATTPHTLKISEDMRVLGFKLYEFQVL